jgi:hypothetical protein
MYSPEPPPPPPPPAEGATALRRVLIGTVMLPCIYICDGTGTGIPVGAGRGGGIPSGHLFNKNKGTVRHCVYVQFSYNSS